jgi:hypothetical protein
MLKFLFYMRRELGRLGAVSGAVIKPLFFQSLVVRLLERILKLSAPEIE